MHQCHYFLGSLALVLLACSGGDNGGSGVDSSKAITDVTVAEAVDICEWSEGLIDEQTDHNIDCFFTAWFDAETPELCQAAYDACLAQDPESSSDCDDVSVDQLPECASMFTIGEMEGCIEARASLVKSAFSTLTCSSTESDLEDLDQTPSACTAIERDCPDLLDN